MAAVCNISEGVEKWFIQLSTNPWSFLSIVDPAWSYPEDEGEAKSSSIAFSVRLMFWWEHLVIYENFKYKKLKNHGCIYIKNMATCDSYLVS